MITMITIMETMITIIIRMTTMILLYDDNVDDDDNDDSDDNDDNDDNEDNDDDDDNVADDDGDDNHDKIQSNSRVHFCWFLTNVPHSCIDTDTDTETARDTDRDVHTSTDRETYTDTTIATDRDIHDRDTEFVRTCIHTASNSMALSAPGLVLCLWWCSSACRSQMVARFSACGGISEYRGDICGVRRGYL